jgi:hypothetical protein
MFMFPPADSMRVLVAAWIVASGFLAWSTVVPMIGENVRRD